MQRGRLPDELLDSSVELGENPIRFRRLLYVAGPYGAATKEEIGRNVARACALGHLATSLGYTPIVPHAMGALGVYGTSGSGDGPKVRRVALACGLGLLDWVAASGGELWVLLQPNGEPSPGTRLEIEAWYEVRRLSGLRSMRSWQRWGERFDQRGLIEVWNEAT